MLLIEATKAWWFRKKNPAAKTELQSGILLLMGPQKPQQERAGSMPGSETVTAKVYPTLKYLVVYLHPVC